MTIYGYARVSSDGQSTAAQDAALHAAGAVKVYAETASGAKTGHRPLVCSRSPLEIWRPSR